MAGGLLSIFTETGWEAVVIASKTGGGVPRVINSLCDRSLYVAFEKGKSVVDIDDVYEAAEDHGIAAELYHYRRKIKNNGKKPETGSIEEKPIAPLLPQTASHEVMVDAKRDYEQMQQQVEESLTKSHEDSINKNMPIAPLSPQTTSPKALKAARLLFLFSLGILALSIIFYLQRL
jgi:general secretion pathway protein A